MRLLPFTYPWIIRTHISSVNKILDIGSGDGSLMKSIYNQGMKVTGVELFDPYIVKSKKTGVYHKILKQDVRSLNSIRDSSYDGILCSQIIEHLTKKEGKVLLNEMERIAKQIIVIGTPHGHYHRAHAYEGNELQKHHSGWLPNDFKSRGYRVYGQGLKVIYGEHGYIESPFFQNTLARGLLLGISYLVSPLVYYFPQFAAHLVAVKHIKN